MCLFTVLVRACFNRGHKAGLDTILVRNYGANPAIIKEPDNRPFIFLPRKGVKDRKPLLALTVPLPLRLK